jgi:hypothetical protein
MDALFQRLVAGGFDALQAFRKHGAEDVDHLSVAVGLTFKFALDLVHLGHGHQGRRPIVQAQWSAPSLLPSAIFEHPRHAHDRDPSPNRGKRQDKHVRRAGPPPRTARTQGLYRLISTVPAAYTTANVVRSEKHLSSRHIRMILPTNDTPLGNVGSKVFLSAIALAATVNYWL